ncbi:MAG: tRNA (N6-threonylcarbamoyladenosine(37)-N6)-methyltransferase TrmO [Gammaproteobacteria bacterium]|nr:tRNA (N6-threonylcarbamoyladenosine(37)-N6)-methyltransferase TrmO [Gammaproteobacteria bacterium]
MGSTDPGGIHLDPIGWVRTDVPDEDVPRRRRDIVSRIELRPALAPALTGIDAYSHLFVIFWMHRAAAGGPLLSHPRGDPSLPATGVLASRGRNHPNPVGLAVVELLERAGYCLTVRRLDAYDGTPVIDIKPYDHYDVFTDLRLPAWLAVRPGN